MTGLQLVDTHLHLEELPDPEETILDAAAAGVTRLITMGTDLASSRGAIALAERSRDVFAAVGHHPTMEGPPAFVELELLLQHPRVVAVGEVGIDVPFTERALDVQVEWFDSACAMAVRNRLPVCVHVRDSAAQVAEVIAAHPGLTGVIHYFSLDWEWAKRFLTLGMYISFAGLTTRATRHELRDAARQCPADRLLLETDAPFGTPRGRQGPNQPAYLVDTAKLVAELRSVSLEDLAALELNNAKALFTKLV